MQQEQQESRALTFDDRDTPALEKARSLSQQAASIATEAKYEMDQINTQIKMIKCASKQAERTAADVIKEQFDIETALDPGTCKE